MNSRLRSSRFRQASSSPKPASKYGARNLRVFGSVARGEDRAKSDIDLLVDMDADGLIGPARPTRDGNGLGETSLIAIVAGLDYWMVERDGQRPPSFPSTGPTKAIASTVGDGPYSTAMRCTARAFIHHGVESSFVARRAADVAAGRPAGRGR